MMYQKAFNSARGQGSSKSSQVSDGSRSRGGWDRRTTFLVIGLVVTTIVIIVCVLLAVQSKH